jgi:prolyl 4-hydroxylase
MESFIYTSKGVLSSELCNKFIDTFNKSDDTFTGITSSGVESENKRSTDITFNPSFKNHPEWKPLLNQLIPILKKQVEIYKNKFFKIYDIKEQNIYNMGNHLSLDSHFNMQHYKPGEGFYSWHCERSNVDNAYRILTWMFFLNDVTDGGGTQFYFQNHTEQAEQGKIVIFSSEYMHAHRGVVSKTEDKYILTGWVRLRK